MWFQSPKIAPFEQGERKVFKGPRPEGSREQGETKENSAGPGTVGAGGGVGALSAAVQEPRGLLSLLRGPLSRRGGAAWKKLGDSLTTSQPTLHSHPRTAQRPQSHCDAPTLRGENGALSGPARHPKTKQSLRGVRGRRTSIVASGDDTKREKGHLPQGLRNSGVRIQHLSVLGFSSAPPSRQPYEVVKTRPCSRMRKLRHKGQSHPTG